MEKGKECGSICVVRRDNSVGPLMAIRDGLTFGSAPNADIRLNLAEQLVKSIHCSIKNVNGFAVLENKCIFFPVLVNNERVLKDVVLRHNDVFEIISKKFKFINPDVTDEKVKEAHFNIKKRMFRTPSKVRTTTIGLLQNESVAAKSDHSLKRISRSATKLPVRCSPRVQRTQSADKAGPSRIPLFNSLRKTKSVNKESLGLLSDINTLNCDLIDMISPVKEVSLDESSEKENTPSKSSNVSTDLPKRSSVRLDDSSTKNSTEWQPLDLEVEAAEKTSNESFAKELSSDSKLELNTSGTKEGTTSESIVTAGVPQGFLCDETTSISHVSNSEDGRDLKGPSNDEDVENENESLGVVILDSSSVREFNDTQTKNEVSQLHSTDDDENVMDNITQRVTRKSNVITEGTVEMNVPEMVIEIEIANEDSDISDIVTPTNSSVGNLAEADENQSSVCDVQQTPTNKDLNRSSLNSCSVVEDTSDTQHRKSVQMSKLAADVSKINSSTATSDSEMREFIQNDTTVYLNIESTSNMQENIKEQSAIDSVNSSPEVNHELEADESLISLKDVNSQSVASVSRSLNLTSLSLKKSMSTSVVETNDYVYKRSRKSFHSIPSVAAVLSCTTSEDLEPESNSSGVTENMSLKKTERNTNINASSVKMTPSCEDRKTTPSCVKKIDSLDRLSRSRKSLNLSRTNTSLHAEIEDKEEAHNELETSDSNSTATTPNVKHIRKRSKSDSSIKLILDTSGTLDTTAVQNGTPKSAPNSPDESPLNTTTSKISSIQTAPTTSSVHELDDLRNTTSHVSTCTENKPELNDTSKTVSLQKCINVSVTNIRRQDSPVSECTVGDAASIFSSTPLNKQWGSEGNPFDVLGTVGSVRKSSRSSTKAKSERLSQKMSERKLKRSLRSSVLISENVVHGCEEESEMPRDENSPATVNVNKAKALSVGRISSRLHLKGLQAINKTPRSGSLGHVDSACRKSLKVDFKDSSTRRISQRESVKRSSVELSGETPINSPNEKGDNSLRRSRLSFESPSSSMADNEPSLVRTAKRGKKRSLDLSKACDVGIKRPKLETPEKSTFSTSIDEAESSFDTLDTDQENAPANHASPKSSFMTSTDSSSFTYEAFPNPPLSPQNKTDRETTVDNLVQHTLEIASALKGLEDRANVLSGTKTSRKSLRNRENFENKPESSAKSVKKLARTPKKQVARGSNSGSLDISGVKELFETPKVQKDFNEEEEVPKNFNEEVPKNFNEEEEVPKGFNEEEEVLKDFNEEDEVPKEDLINVEVQKGTRKPQSPINDLTNFVGVRRLLRTPKPQKEPANDLSDLRGVRSLMKTPLVRKSPKNDLTDVKGVKRLLRTPREVKSPKNDLTNVDGVKKLLKTPKLRREVKNDLTDVRGVKKLLSTPKQAKSPENDLTDVIGVKKLLKTPRLQKVPSNDLSDVVGVKRLLRTPRVVKSPKNDLTKIVSLKRVWASPVLNQSPLNDLTDVRGVKKLFKTPVRQKSPRNDLSDVSGVHTLFGEKYEQAFDALIEKKHVKTYTRRTDSTSPRANEETQIADEDSSVTLETYKWVQEQQTVDKPQKRRRNLRSESTPVKGVGEETEPQIGRTLRNRRNVVVESNAVKKDKKSTEAKSEVKETVENIKGKITTTKARNRRNVTKQQDEVSKSRSTSPAAAVSRTRRQANKQRKELRQSDDTIVTKASEPEKRATRARRGKSPNTESQAKKPTSTIVEALPDETDRSARKTRPQQRKNEDKPEVRNSRKRKLTADDNETVSESVTIVFEAKTTRSTKRKIAELVRLESPVQTTPQKLNIGNLVKIYELRRSKRTPQKPSKYNEDFLYDSTVTSRVDAVSPPKLGNRRGKREKTEMPEGTKPGRPLKNGKSSSRRGVTVEGPESETEVIPARRLRNRVVK